VRNLLRQTQRKERPAPPLQAEVAELEARLRESLGTRVSLKRGEKGGQLTIYFYSDEELEELMRRLEKDGT